jgi:hypothetical protein
VSIDTAFLFHYFYPMRAIFLLLVLMVPGMLRAQVRLSRLELKRHEVYEIKQADILVVDTLIMNDSSRLVFDHQVTENFLHVKKLIIHGIAYVDGHGIHGLRGRNGRTGSSPSSPCTPGGVGLAGTEGTNGGRGLTLSLYLSDIDIKGKLVIDVSGGDAGDGGNGGRGGGGGPGTRLCAGGNGGNGGPGSKGGNGGDAGIVNLIAPRIPELRSMLDQTVIVRNYGGNHGLGGNGGAGGDAGLSPTGNTKLDGKTGRKGPRGLDGIAGKPGTINFPDK